MIFGLQRYLAVASSRGDLVTFSFVKNDAVKLPSSRDARSLASLLNPTPLKELTRLEREIILAVLAAPILRIFSGYQELVAALHIRSQIV